MVPVASAGCGDGRQVQRDQLGGIRAAGLTAIRALGATPGTVAPDIDGEDADGSSGVAQATLVHIRWWAIVGQLVTVLAVHYGLEFSLPLIPCLMVIAASGLINTVAWLRQRSPLRGSTRHTAFYLGFDLVQFTALLHLTGGLENPFAVLMLAPQTAAALALPLRGAVALSGVSIGCLTLLFFWHLPLPGRCGRRAVQQSVCSWQMDRHDLGGDLPVLLHRSSRPATTSAARCARGHARRPGPKNSRCPQLAPWRLQRPMNSVRPSARLR